MTTEAPTVSLDDLHDLQHTLGVSRRLARAKWGYRNYYDSGKERHPGMERLCRAGLAYLRATPREDLGTGYVYGATAEGADLLGLTRKAINEVRAQAEFERMRSHREDE